MFATLTTFSAISLVLRNNIFNQDYCNNFPNDFPTGFLCLFKSIVAPACEIFLNNVIQVTYLQCSKHLIDFKGHFEKKKKNPNSLAQSQGLVRLASSPLWELIPYDVPLITLLSHVTSLQCSNTLRFLPQDIYNCCSFHPGCSSPGSLHDSFLSSLQVSI